MTLLLLAIQFSHGRRFDVRQDNDADDEKIDSGLPGARFIELKREKKVGLEGFPTFNEREEKRTQEDRCDTLSIIAQKCGSPLFTKVDKKLLCTQAGPQCKVDLSGQGCTYPRN